MNTYTGVAFAEGCTSRPDECWVVENFNTKTCIRDDRKCLQGAYSQGLLAASTAELGVLRFSGLACMLKIEAFLLILHIKQDPIMSCKHSNRMMINLSSCFLSCHHTGFGVYPSEDACCAPNAAFSEGCREVRLCCNRILQLLQRSAAVN